MILHCMICSRGGEHPGEHSKLAIVDEDNLRLPLVSTCFNSYNPERGLPAPWAKGIPWQVMWCPRGQHLPWGINPMELKEAFNRGGPEFILTDEGRIYLFEDGWRRDKGQVVEQMIEPPYPKTNAEINEESQMTAMGALDCPHCSFTAKSEQGLKVHMTLKHKDVPIEAT